MSGFTLTAGAAWIASLAFIAVSMYMHFGEKLRILAGLVVGSGLSAATGSKIKDVVSALSKRIANGVDGLSAYEAAAIAAALPTIISCICAVIVWRYLRGGGHGHGHGRRLGGYGRSSGGGQIPPSVALAAAIVLPVLIPGIGAAIGGSFQ